MALAVRPDTSDLEVGADVRVVASLPDAIGGDEVSWLIVDRPGTAYGVARPAGRDPGSRVVRRAANGQLETVVRSRRSIAQLVD